MTVNLGTLFIFDFNELISFLISCFKILASFFPSIIIIKINLEQTFQKQNFLKTLALKLISLEKYLLNLSLVKIVLYNLKLEQLIYKKNQELHKQIYFQCLRC